jgi:hypothetical protein
MRKNDKNRTKTLCWWDKTTKKEQKRCVGGKE